MKAKKPKKTPPPPNPVKKTIIKAQRVGKARKATTLTHCLNCAEKARNMKPKIKTSDIFEGLKRKTTAVVRRSKRLRSKAKRK